MGDQTNKYHLHSQYGHEIIVVGDDLLIAEKTAILLNNREVALVPDDWLIVIEYGCVKD